MHSWHGISDFESGHLLYCLHQPFQAWATVSLLSHSFLSANADFSSAMPDLPFSLYLQLFTSIGVLGYHPCSLSVVSSVPSATAQSTGSRILHPSVNLPSNTKISPFQVSHILGHSSSNPNINTERKIRLETYMSGHSAAASFPCACSLWFHVSSLSLSARSLSSFRTLWLLPPARNSGLGSYTLSLGYLILVLLPWVLWGHVILCLASFSVPPFLACCDKAFIS